MGLSRMFRLAAALLIAGSAPLALAQELSLLQWSHFVPRYDEWFDAYAEDWGEANGFRVRVDHVNVAELPAALAAAIKAGEGPSIIEMAFPPTAFIEGLHPLNDVNEAAAAAHGERTANCQATSYLPINDAYVGFTHGYIPDPGDYQISLWADVGMPDGPSTWEELYEGGRAVFEKHGVPVGLGMSPELDSRMATRAAIWSHGGSVQDANENVVLDSPETVAAVKFLARLQNDTMTEEIFGWTASSNNQGRFPRGHWRHLRMTNVIESPFAALRLRTDAAKRFKKVANATAVVWKMLLVAERKFRRINSPELLRAVATGQQYHDDLPIRRGQEAAEAAA